MKPIKKVAPTISQKIFSLCFIWAALGFVVMAFCVAPMASQLFRGDQNIHTEIGPSRASENVFIRDSSVNMENEGSLRNPTHLSKCELAMEYESMDTALPWPDCCYAGIWRWRQGIVEITWNEGRHNADVGNNLNIRSGSQSVINKDGPEIKLVSFSLPAVLSGLDRNISPQLPLGGVLSQVSLGLSSAPKTMGDDPEADGGYRENYRKSGNNRLVVVVVLDPLKPAFEHDKRASKEGGAVLMFIVIGGLLTVLWFYKARS